MCMECGQFNCHPMCPNAPDPEKLYKCAYCKEAIVEGEDFVKYNDGYYHEECFADKAPVLAIDAEGMTCFEEVENDDTQVGVCKFCEEPVLRSEHHYRWRKGTKRPDKDLETSEVLYVHHECLMDSAELLLEDDTTRGVAEAEDYEPDYDLYDD